MRVEQLCFVCLLLLLACSDGVAPPAPAPAVVTDALVAELEGRSPDERIQRILQVAEQREAGHTTALLHLMKDRSQVAFHVVADAAAPFGLKAIELTATGADLRSMERVAAIAVLQRLQVREALPDLLLALDDRHPVVVNHAAAALLALGCRAGLPYLLAHAEGRNLTTGEFMASPAFAGESADVLLRACTAEDAGYNADAGFTHKQEAAARWRVLVEQRVASGRPFVGEGRLVQQGDDAATDRRINFFVDVVGQMQFLYHEQARRMLTRLGVAALPSVRDGIERGRKSGNATLLAGLAQVLGGIAHANSEVLLVALVREKHPTVASRAASALAQLGTPGAVAALKDALETPAVRLAALEALGQAGVAGAAVLRTWNSDDAEALKVRTLALFEASAAHEAAAPALAMLLSDSLADRNRALAVVQRTLKTDGGYQSTADAAARTAAVELLKSRLP